MHLDLSELCESSIDTAREIRQILLSGDRVTHRSEPKRDRKRGRPKRSDQISGDLLAAAPFPELLVEPADKLARTIRRIKDPELLREAHRFELASDRRKSVLKRIEDRLASLGHRLGGPQEPLAGYDELSVAEVLDRIDRSDPETAAAIHAFEFYGRRRDRRILAQSKKRGGERAQELVDQTSPKAELDSLQEPFPGYDDLAISSDTRSLVKERLSERTREEIEAALAYERETKQRIGMIDAINRALTDSGHS